MLSTRNLLILGAGVVIGIIFASRQTPKGKTPLQKFESLSRAAMLQGTASSLAILIPPTRSASIKTARVLKTTDLNIVGADGETAIRLLPVGDGGAALSLARNAKSATVQMGVRANGFPFVLISDEGLRNFGIGRVDGKNATPILAFRHDGEVRSMLGLDMTQKGTPPFFVHFTGDGKKHEFLGKYCDALDRVCTD